jgi:hypothetical protein
MPLNDGARGARAAPHNNVLFVVTLWLALATALLCAIWPAGLPLTKTIGSAFSPSTTIVALRGRAEQVRPPVRKAFEAEPEILVKPLPVSDRVDIVIPQQPVLRLQQLAPASLAPTFDAAPILTGKPPRAFHARGPPIA